MNLKLPPTQNMEPGNSTDPSLHFLLQPPCTSPCYSAGGGLDKRDKAMPRFFEFPYAMLP